MHVVQHKKQPYYYQVDTKIATNSSSFDYADDLNEIYPTIEHLQQMAVILSAFNVITEFSVALTTKVTLARSSRQGVEENKSPYETGTNHDDIKCPN